MLIKLTDFRGKVRQFYSKNFKTKTNHPLCNGLLLHDNFTDLNLLIESVEKELVLAKTQRLIYCVGEWSKLLLHLYFVDTLASGTKGNLWKHFELSRRPEDFEVIDAHFNASNWSEAAIGLLYDHHLETFWIISGALVVRVPIDHSQIQNFLKKTQSICSQNSNSLRNTREISDDQDKTAEWWRIRKSLDANLNDLCCLMEDAMFSDILEMVIYSSDEESSILQEELTNFVRMKGSKVAFKPYFVKKLMQFGILPRRNRLEVLLRMIEALDYSFNIDDIDALIFKLRGVFESAFNTSSQEVVPKQRLCMNLFLDKHLNCIPFESFACFSKTSFVRVPSWSWARTEEKDKPAGKGAFYVLNPSGDLIKTQLRFEELFRRYFL